jgi:hypothetical protein
MCGGGGGGDGGAEERRRQEEARVASAVSQINNIFGVGNPDAMAEREALYGTVKEDAVKKAMTDLDKDKEKAARELNFMLARQGLSGGSADVDQNRQLTDTYQQGILKAANIGDSTANNMRSSDDKTRVNLVNNIRSGLDGGQASQMAYEGMKNNADLARTEANNANLVGFFNNLMNGWNSFQYGQNMNQVIDTGKKQNQFGNSISGDDGTIRSIK